MPRAPTDHEHPRLPHAGGHAEQGRQRGRGRPSRCEAARITRLPAFCHCGTYIQSWPLKGCEKMAVGRPGVDQLQQRLAAAEGQVDEQQGVGPGQLRHQRRGGGVRGWGSTRRRRTRTSPSRCWSPSRCFWNLATSAVGVELGLGPRPAQADVDHVDLHRRQLRPAGLFGGLQGPRGHTAGQQHPAGRGSGSQEITTIHGGVMRRSPLRAGSCGIAPVGRKGIGNFIFVHRADPNRGRRVNQAGQGRPVSGPSCLRSRPLPRRA